MQQNKIPKERQEVLDKIAKNEELGGENFFNDVENDPPIKTLMPEDVDYLKKKLSSKLKNWACRRTVTKMLKKYAEEHNIEVIGLENLKGIKGGAVLTTNHFHFLLEVDLKMIIKKNILLKYLIKFKFVWKKEKLWF